MDLPPIDLDLFWTRFAIATGVIFVVVDRIFLNQAAFFIAGIVLILVGLTTIQGTRSP